MDQLKTNNQPFLIPAVIIFSVLVILNITSIWQNYKLKSDQNFNQTKINGLNNKIIQLETDKNELLAQLKDTQLLPPELRNDKTDITNDNSTINPENESLNIYRNEMYGYEIKYPTSLSLNSKTTISNWDGTGITINNPIIETGYEAWEVTKTEKIKISDSEKFLTKKYFSPRMDPPKEEKDKFKPFILATWGEDDWKNSGQIGFSYKDNSDPNLKLYNEILSTLKLVGPKEKISTTTPNTR